MNTHLTRRRFCTALAGLGAAGFSRADETKPALPRLSRTNMLLWRDAEAKEHPVRTVEEWQHRRAAVIAGMEEIMGKLPGREKNCPLDVKIEEENETGDVVRRRITYSSEPNGRVPAWLLIPKAALKAGAGRTFPAALGLHQTRKEGPRIVAGLDDSPDDAYGLELAKMGVVVLAPVYPHLAGYAPDLAGLGYVSGTMKAIHDNRRGLDLLESLPFVKTGRFGTIGHSLGGHNSVFTAAFDSRIAVVVSSCGLDLFTDYYGGKPDVWQPGRGWCGERYMPRLLKYKDRLADIPFDFQEIISALAPRHVFVSAPYGDTNFRWQSVDTIATAAGQIYTLHGQPSHLQVEHPDCEHRFHPDVRARACKLIKDVLTA